MTTEIDTIALTDVQERFQIGRTALYDRLKALGITPEKIGNKSYINSEQLAQMEALHEHLKTGKLSDFMASHSPRTPNSQSGQLAQPVATVSGITPSAIEVIDRVLDRLLQTAVQAAPKSKSVNFANLEALDRAADKRWHLSSSQVKDLLGVASLPKSPFTRFGFSFEKAGKNGNEAAWRITKIGG